MEPPINEPWDHIPHCNCDDGNGPQWTRSEYVKRTTECKLRGGPCSPNYKTPDDHKVAKAEPEVVDGVSPPATGDLGFTDIEAALNMRDWLQRAIEMSGAKIEGGGMGCGAGDLWFNLDGCTFFVSIKPVTK